MVKKTESRQLNSATSITRGGRLKAAIIKRKVLVSVVGVAAAVGAGVAVQQGWIDPALAQTLAQLINIFAGGAGQ